MSRVRWPIPSHDPNPLGRTTPLAGVGLRLLGEDVLTNEIALRDLFTRSVTDSWGRSTSGHNWINDGESTAIDVDGEKGTFNPTSSAGAYVYLGSKHGTGLLKWSFSDVPTGNLNRITIAVANNDSFSAYEGIVIENNNGGELRPFINTGPATVVMGYSHPDWWYARFEFLPSSSLKLKIWKVGDVEPSNWTVEGKPLGRSGLYFGIKASRFSTNPVTFSIDDLDVLAGPISANSFDEAIAEIVTNEATSTQTLLSAEAQEANNGGTGSFTVADAIAETVTNSAQSTQTISEAIADTLTNEIRLVDTFTRTVVDGWGRSNSGHDWLSGNPALIDVDGSRGTMNPTGIYPAANAIADATTVINSGHLSGILKWAFSNVWTDNGKRLIVLFQSDTEDLNIRIEDSTGSRIEMSLWYSQIEALTGVHIVVNPYIYSDEYYLRFEMIGSDLRAKSWKVGDSEPANWQLSVRDNRVANRTKFAFTDWRFSTVAVGSIIDDIDILAGPRTVNTFSEAAAEDSSHSGSSSQSGLEAEAQNIDNAATADITLEETIFVPGAVKPTIIQVKAHSYPELVPITKFIGAFTISSLEIVDTLTNEATSNQTLSEAEAQAIDNSSSSSITVLSAEAQDLNNSGQGSFTVADATAETVSVSQTSTQDILEALAETITSDATAIITLTAEATAETNTNTATNTPAILSAEAQDINNSGTGSFITADATAEIVLSSATSDQTILELIAIIDDLLNFATSVISILSAEAQEANNSGSGSFTTADATAETVLNSATADQTILEDIFGTVTETIDNVSTSSIAILSAEAQDANISGTGSFSVADATAEIILNSATAIQTIEEALAETFTNSATNAPAIISSDLETLVNTGTASHTDAEAIAESMASSTVASHSMLENGTVRLFPDEDISTGTWHDTPLWPKIDEMSAVGGYPTEAIISGEDPVNDTAVLGLQSGSDPQMDIDHFINVQFYKIGSPADDIDFIIKLKQGATVIATRTFTDVQETESAPRTERIGLTTGEVANITNYADLRFEIIANKTN